MSNELNKLIAKANAGSAAAKYELAVKHRNGFGLRKNPVQAFKLFAEAAKLNHAHSCCVLGQMYERGEGTDPDDAQAVKFYSRAAESGHAGGKFGLSRMYEFGRGGLTRDLDEAVRLCGEAAKKGHEAALRKLSEFAENGRFDAALRLARLHRLGIRGVLPRDFERAADLYRLAANLTEDETRKHIALRKRADLYRREADGGNDRARLKLAALYENGNGVKQNDGEALKLYREAAETRNECLPAFLRGKLFDLGCVENRELLLNDCRQSLGRLSPEREAAFSTFAGMLNALSAEELNGFARYALPLGPADRTRGWRSTLQTTGENRRDALKNPVAHIVRRAPLALAALELQRLARIASALGEAKLAREAREAAKSRLETLLDAPAPPPAASGENGSPIAPRLLKAA